MSDTDLQRRISSSRVDIIELSNGSGQFKQYYTCFVVSLLCLSRGLTTAWSSPMLQILERDDSPVGKMNTSQINTLQTISQFSSMAGLALTVITLFKCGTKKSAQAQAVAGLIGYIVLVFATSPTVLYIGRFLCGMNVVGVTVVSAFFLSEISSDVRRGALIAYSMFGSNVGTLSGSGLGVVVTNYQIFNAICLIPLAAFLVLFFWIPESPPYLLRRGQLENALASYMWYHDASLEAAQLYIHKMATFSRTRLNMKDIFSEKSNRRALVIVTFVVAYPQLCGLEVITSYTSVIFENAECTLTPNQSTLLLAIVTFVSALLAALLIDRAGRRILTIGSFILMSIALFTVVYYFAAKEYEWIEFKSYEWLVYVGLGGFQGASTMGVLTVSQALVSELVPTGVKGMIWMVAGIASLILSFVTVQIYQLITTHAPYYVNFFQEAIFTTVAVVIAWFIVPETKGKSLAQITAELRGEIYDPHARNRLSGVREDVSLNI